MLGPANRVAKGRRLFAPRVLADDLGDLQEGLLGAAGDLLDHLGGVLGEVALEDLEDAPLVLEGLVGRTLALVGFAFSPGFLTHDAALDPSNGRVIDGLSLVAPTRYVVRLCLLIPTGEEARLAHVFELLGYEGGGVGVVDDVLLEVLLVLDDVVDEAAQERYVRPSPYRGVDVAHGARAGEARVHVDELRALLARDHWVPEAYRVRLSHIRALDDDAVGVLQVHEVSGGAAPTVRGAQTGHRGAVSYARLVCDSRETQGVEELGDEVVLLVVY